MPSQVSVTALARSRFSCSVYTANTTWLDSLLEDRDKLLPLLRSYAAEDLIATPVSTYVNSPRNEGPNCVQVQRELF